MGQQPRSSIPVIVYCLKKQGATTTGTYTYGNALIRKDGDTPLYDGLGTARAETSSAQAVTFSLIPDAFGNTVTSTGSTSSTYGFAATSGYRTDGDAGLMKVGCRYYDPQVGSFTTRDTFLDQKPYLYCEHDPVNGVDPSGHDDESDGNWELVQGGFVGGATYIGGTLGGPLGGVVGGIIGQLIYRKFRWNSEHPHRRPHYWRQDRTLMWGPEPVTFMPA